mgnify:CR=1 FL=1
MPTYYDMTKHIARLRYQDRKEKAKLALYIPENYYYLYWKNAEWKKVVQKKINGFFFFFLFLT